MTAWVEVPFEGVGWVPFRPTPDQTDVPQDQTPKPKSEPQPQVRQPPRAEHDEEQLLTGVEIDDTDDDRDRPFVLPGWVWVAVAAVGIPAALVLLPMLVVALVKGVPPPPASQRRERPPRRRARGRSSSTATPSSGSSRRRRARGCSPPAPLERQVAEQGLAAPAAPPTPIAPAAAAPVRLSTLAATIDRDVFAGGDVSDAVVEDRWRTADAATEAVARAAGRLRRLVSRYRLHAPSLEWSGGIAGLHRPAARVDPGGAATERRARPHRPRAAAAHAARVPAAARRRATARPRPPPTPPVDARTPSRPSSASRRRPRARSPAPGGCAHRADSTSSCCVPCCSGAIPPPIPAAPRRRRSRSPIRRDPCRRPTRSSRWSRVASIVTDLHSTNGTRVLTPDGETRELDPGRGAEAPNGATLLLGEFAVRLDRAPLNSV